MNQEDNLDLLDLDEGNEVDTLPEATPFSAPRPKRPWLLMGLGFAVIVLASWIIVAHIGSDSGTSINIDLDTPVAEQQATNAPQQQPVADLKVPAQPVAVAPAVKPVMPEQKVEAQPEQPKPIEAKPVESNGAPIRVVQDRKEVTFNPDKQTTQKTATKVTAAKKTTVAKKTTSASNGSIYVQFGSYSTRALAAAAEQKIRAAHGNLFNGKQFVILAAEVKGQTTYRLRIAFHSANEANGFCRNAKSDGLDCYVTK